MTARRPTMDDVAEVAGVSRALVSLVMRGSPKVSDQRRSAVLTAARTLGYSPDLIARTLASRTSSVVGVITADLRRPGLADLVDGLDSLAESEGLELVLGTAGRRSSARARAVATLGALRPAGLVVIDDDPRWEDVALLGDRTPVVLIGRPLPQTRLGTRVDVVDDDGQAGTGLLVDHLVTMGHRRIVHLAGGESPTSLVRRTGYERAMARHGLDPLVVPSGVTEASGVAGVQRLLADRSPVTAIVASDDLCAIGALAALEDAGIAVPEEVSVVGYGNSTAGALAHVALTTAAPRRTELGELAVRALLDRVRGTRSEPVRHLLLPRLMIRRTAGPAR